MLLLLNEGEEAYKYPEIPYAGSTPQLPESLCPARAKVTSEEIMKAVVTDIE